MLDKLLIMCYNKYVLEREGKGEKPIANVIKKIKKFQKTP
jgi:hypothetical protein